MFKMKNGILFKDQKPVFCVGLSYYPSFHPAKVPVPPEGDRIGEMKKDLLLMKEAGFNLVRTAALGDVKLENDEVKFDVSFIDSMLEEADKLDILILSILLDTFFSNFAGFYYLYNQPSSQSENYDAVLVYNGTKRSKYHYIPVRRPAATSYAAIAFNPS